MPGCRNEERSKSGVFVKKRKDRTGGIKSSVWLEVAARKAGIPYLEYACMPLGELSDFLDFYAVSEGNGKLTEIRDEQYIPGVR